LHFHHEGAKETKFGEKKILTTKSTKHPARRGGNRISEYLSQSNSCTNRYNTGDENGNFWIAEDQ